MGYRREKRDAAEPEVVRTLEALGWSVERLPGGGGRPDLLVGRRGLDRLVEVKTGRHGLRENQRAWSDAWRGSKTCLLRSQAEVIAWERAGCPAGWRPEQTGTASRGPLGHERTRRTGSSIPG